MFLLLGILPMEISAVRLTASSELQSLDLGASVMVAGEITTIRKYFRSFIIM